MRIVCILPTLGRNLDWLEESMSSVHSQDALVSGILATDKIGFELKYLCEKYDFEILKTSSKGVFAVINEVLNIKHEDFDAYFFLGDDDLMHASAVRNLCAILQKGNLDIAYGKINYIDEDGSEIFINHAFSISKHFLRIFPNLIPNPGTIIKMEVWKKLGGYNLNYKYAADLDFWIRSRKDFRIGATKHLVASFRYHDNSLTGGNRDSSRKEAEEIRVAGLNILNRKIVFSIQHLSTIVGEFWFRHLLNRKKKEKIQK